MKKILGLGLGVVLVSCLIAVAVFASIEKTTAEARFGKCLSAIKSQVMVDIEQLISLRNRAQEIVTIYGGQLDALDKDKLPALKTKMNEVIAKQQELVDDIKTAFPDIE